MDTLVQAELSSTLVWARVSVPGTHGTHPGPAVPIGGAGGLPACGRGDCGGAGARRAGHATRAPRVFAVLEQPPLPQKRIAHVPLSVWPCVYAHTHTHTHAHTYVSWGAVGPGGD